MSEEKPRKSKTIDHSKWIHDLNPPPDKFKGMEWRELDNAVRKWVVFSHFQKDLDAYWQNADFGSHDPI